MPNKFRPILPADLIDFFFSSDSRARRGELRAARAREPIAQGLTGLFPTSRYFRRGLCVSSSHRVALRIGRRGTCKCRATHYIQLRRSTPSHRPHHAPEQFHFLLIFLHFVVSLYSFLHVFCVVIFFSSFFMLHYIFASSERKLCFQQFSYFSVKMTEIV